MWISRFVEHCNQQINETCMLFNQLLGDMSTEFKKLNEDWNAQPNSPSPVVKIEGLKLILEFSPNHFVYPDYEAFSKITLTFHDCWRYRIGTVNDEGWYRGQCRFSNLAPGWGEFYEVRGDLHLENVNDWIEIQPPTKNPKHYLFYFRDEEFECDASSWKRENVA